MTATTQNPGGNVNTGSTPAPAPAPLDPSQSTLSPNFAPYIYDMLSMGQGLANLSYRPYTGNRYAGPSALQRQAFQGIAGLETPAAFQQATDMFGQAGRAGGAFSYAPGQFGDLGFNANQITTGLGPVGSVSDYMNPYTENVTNILSREATRQSEIQRQADQARLAKAGAYGGSRQAIMDAERARNLATQLGDIQEKGLASAYEQAQKQRLAEAQLGTEAQRITEAGRQFGATYGLDTEKAKEQSRQFGARTGLDALNQQIAAAQGLSQTGTAQLAADRALQELRLGAGQTQRGLRQDDLDFAYQQWQESMKWPYQQATFMQSLLQGLPLQARSYESGQSALAAALQGGLSGLALYRLLANTPTP